MNTLFFDNTVTDGAITELGFVLERGGVDMVKLNAAIDAPGENGRGITLDDALTMFRIATESVDDVVANHADSSIEALELAAGCDLLGTLPYGIMGSDVSMIRQAAIDSGMTILFFDTETTGLPKANPATGGVEQPRITQLGLILERGGIDLLTVDALIKPDNWPIYEGFCKAGIAESGTGISRVSSEITGITQDMCEKDGIPIRDAVELFVIAAEYADLIVCHNTAFDVKVIAAEYGRLRDDVSPRTVLGGKPYFCTMKTATPVCKIMKGDKKTSFKWPKLIECMEFFYKEKLENAHSAIVDIKATRRVFHTLIEGGHFTEQFQKAVAEGKLPKHYLTQLGVA